MIDTILFDFDGTLINTNEVIIAAWQHTYRHYTGEEAETEHITACFGEPLLITMAREFPEVDPEESAEIYRTYQREKAKELVKLFPGVETMLRELKSRGYKTGIVTSRTGESTLRYLEMFNIGGYFDAIVSCDDTDKHKPDPEPVLLGLDKLEAVPEETVMVGDSFFDMKSANNAGVKTVLVNWRMAGAEKEPEGCKVDCRIDTPMELIDVLEEM